MTSLHYAAMNNHLLIVQFLIEKGSKIQNKSQFGNSAIDHAKLNHHFRFGLHKFILLILYLHNKSYIELTIFSMKLGYDQGCNEFMDTKLRNKVVISGHLNTYIITVITNNGYNEENRPVQGMYINSHGNCNSRLQRMFLFASRVRYCGV